MSDDITAALRIAAESAAVHYPDWQQLFCSAADRIDTLTESLASISLALIAVATIAKQRGITVDDVTDLIRNG